MPIIFMGGGAELMKRITNTKYSLCRPILLTDICANAKGYEVLTRQLLEKKS